jgi:hypothetical protein
VDRESLIAQEERRAIVSAAQFLLAGKVPFLEGVLTLAALRFAASKDGFDPDFMLLVAISSETDHLPPQHARQYCAPEWLQKCDAEERSVQALYSADVQQLCRKLITRFTEHGEA